MNLTYIVSVSIALILTGAGSAQAAEMAVKSWIPFESVNARKTSQALELSRFKRTLDAFYTKLLNSADKHAEILQLPFDHNFQAYEKEASRICGITREPYCGLGNPAFDVQEYSPNLNSVNSTYTSFSAVETQSNRILFIVVFNAYPEMNSTAYLRTVAFPLNFKDGTLKIHDIINVDSEGREASTLRRLISESDYRK